MEAEPSLEEAVSQERLEEVLLPLDLPVQSWPGVEVTEEQVQSLLYGQALVLSVDAVPPGQERARAFDSLGRFLALLRVDESTGAWRPFRVFPPLEHRERTP